MANSFHNLPSAFTPLTPTATPPGTSSNTSSSLSSETSSIVSRQSSTRSTTSVVAVPIRKPVRGPAHAPLNRANSSGIGRGFDSSSVSVVTPAPTTLAAGTGGSYFAGALPSGAPPMRRGSSGEGAVMRTPPANSGDGRMSDWTAVGAAVTGIKTGEDETPTRPSAGRAPSSATTQATSRPTRDRDGSASSVTLIRKTVGDFTVGEVLGEGSYSTVSLVTDKHPPHRSYALKMLDKDHIKREKKTKYVLIERDTLKTLDGHPGIVRLYWTFQDQRSLYYVLELAKNGELLKWIKKFGSFHLPSARFYAAQILSAVEHMHSKGVIHRDLKPENILLDDKMRVKITDFGTAKLQSTAAKEEEEDPSKPRSRSFVGTPEYVSPEILSEKKESSPSSDYWGFGCILYQILAGRPPFQARTEYLMFQKIINLEYEFPLGFPPDAKDLVEKLLIVDPRERLGGGPEGVAAIKAHPFFTASEPPIDFSTIWTIEPPAIVTGLAEPKKEIKGEFVLLDEFGAEDDDEEDDESGGSGGEESGRRSDSYESERDAVSSAGRTSDDGPRTKWAGILLPTETIVFASPILVRRGLFTKKRSLILTDYPRLICIKDAPDKVTLKSEVFVGAALKGGVTKPGAVAFVKAEKEGDRGFVIKTSQQTYKYEEPTGAAGRWVNELREAHAQGLRAPAGR